MANTITIKHGPSTPDADDLENFELGYATDKGGNRLYIKDSSGNIRTLARRVFILNGTPAAADCKEGDIWILIGT